MNEEEIQEEQDAAYEAQNEENAPMSTKKEKPCCENCLNITQSLLKDERICEDADCTCHQSESIEWVSAEVIKGVGGNCLSIGDFRVAGPKPLGGGTVVEKFNIRLSTLLDLDCVKQAITTAVAKNDRKWNDKANNAQADGYEIGEEIGMFKTRMDVEEAIAAREKELVEEVEKMIADKPQWAFSKDALQKVLSLLKH